MEAIDKNNLEKIGKNNGKVTNKELLETIEKGKLVELKQLFEGYFSMIEHLGEIDYLVNNVNQYDEILSELIKFSKTPFMEERVWRVSDNRQFEEYCGAHLRNLLSPFKNMIALIKDFSKGDIKEDTFRLFVNKFGLNFEENKKLFLEFCEFLDENL